MNQMADKAAAKGSKQSLFMMGNTAMVVSIKKPRSHHGGRL